jgi:SAM-dependent methyltransferase
MIIRTLKDTIKTILHRRGIDLSIDWDKKYKKLGSGSVFDSRTPELLRQETTDKQSKLYKSLLEKRLYKSDVSRVIDFGCGIGRHFPLLSGFSSINSKLKIDGFDPTLGLLKEASKHNYNKLFSSNKNLKKEISMILYSFILFLVV